MVRHESIRATIYLLSSLTLVILPRLSLSCMNYTYIHIHVCDSPLSVSTTPSPLLSFPSFFLFFFSDHMSLFLSLSLLFLLVELTCFFVFLNRTLHDRSSLSIGLSSLQSAVIFSCRSYFRRAHPTSSPEAALHGLFSAHCLEAPAEVTGFPG